MICLTDFLILMVFSYISNAFDLITLLSITIILDLFYIVDQAVDQPLDIHLVFSSESKPVQLLVGTNIGKYRLDDSQTQWVNFTAQRSFDFIHHLFGKTTSEGN